MLDVRGNFCNLYDSSGMPIFTHALPGAPPEKFAEWMRLQVEAGSTHLIFGCLRGGDPYDLRDGTRLYPWDNPNYWNDLPAFRKFVERLLDYPSASGAGFTPVILIGDGPSMMPEWPRLADALEGLDERLVMAIDYEPVIGDWRSSEVSKGLRLLRKLFPKAVILHHFSPERWVSSSNPEEPDDPWHGGEGAFGHEHGGEVIDIVAYQLPHGDGIYKPCTCDLSKSPTAPLFGHHPWFKEDPEWCWLNRFEDGVARYGQGYHGWRRIPVCLMETVAYETARRRKGVSADARRIATDGRDKVAALWGVTITYGNGLPYPPPLTG
jgi:hypothetical protein